MTKRKITYEDYSNLSGTSDLAIDDVIFLFEDLDWKQEGTFFTLEFTDSFMQFLSEDESNLTVEIMLDENDMKIARKNVSHQEAIELIKYYYENDSISIDDSYAETYI